MAGKSLCIAESLKYDIPGTQSFWITPDRKLINIGNQEHIDWLVNNCDKYYKCALISKHNQDVLDKAIKDGWVRIGYWPQGSDGAWLEMDFKPGTDIEKVLKLIPHFSSLSRVYLSDIGGFEVENNDIMKSYQDYLKRANLINQKNINLPRPEIMTPTNDENWKAPKY